MVMVINLKVDDNFCVGDDDSGTDENGDTPPFSPTPPPTSGFLMAKKMKIGCSNEPLSQSSDPSVDQDDGLTHSSALAVMFASSVPTPDDLAQLKKKKKVRERWRLWGTTFLLKLIDR